MGTDGSPAPAARQAAMGDTRGHFAQLGDVVLAAAAEPSLLGTLRRLVHGAKRLTGARYAALGVPDETGAAFRQFLHVGMPPETVAALGPLPRTHGLLGAMLSDPRSYTTTDITRDPRFEGWPSAHPPMRHFLGMPLVTGGRVVGAFYLTGEVHDRAFDESDQELMTVLAAHAAVAVENARLLEVSRETAIAEERTRLSRELHDAVVQNVFGLRLAARTAARRLPADPHGAARDVARIETLAGEALRELRGAIEHLSPADLRRDGLAMAITAHARLISHAEGATVDVSARPPAHDPRWGRLPADTATAVLRIVQEAMNNAVRHSGANRVVVTLARRDDSVEATVTDTGSGFSPAAVGARGLGLASMRERAAAVDADLSVSSAPMQGTQVRVSAGIPT